ncbi:MAG: flippase-like domain-containing protein [Candidatus Aenigmarchaeota archaeon]|nr:flippase-like domain-containing protein [Candidatus Aenigmarchaeota archaeon]
MMKPIAGLISGIVLVLLSIYFIGTETVLNTLAQMNLNYLSWAIYLTLTIMLLHSIRLKMILDAQKYQLGLWNATKIHVASNTANLMTPVVKVGGIPLKVHYLSRANLPSMMSCASVIGEIATETFSFYSTFILILAYLTITNHLPPNYTYLGILMFGLFVLFFLGSFKVLMSQKRLERFIKSVILRFTTINAKLASKQLNCSINTFFSNVPLFYGTLAISFFCRLLEFARLSLIFLALGLNVGLGIVLTLWILEAFLSGLPWLPGSVGLVEIGSISVLAVLQMPAALAASIILLSRVVSYWIPLFIGGAVMSRLKRHGVRCEL